MIWWYIIELVIQSSLDIKGLSCGRGIGCVHPHPIKLATGKHGFILLYYTPYPPDEAELPFLSFSLDGILFYDKFLSNPLFTRGSQGAWDEHHLADVDIVYYNDLWHMYFAGATYINGIKLVSIGKAVSRDGFFWHKEAKPVLVPDLSSPWEKGTSSIKAVATPSVIPYRDKLLMYYEGFGSDGVSRILLAESKDGRHFYRIGKVLEPYSYWNKMGVNHPHVSYLDDNYILMLFVGHNGTCYSLGYALFDTYNPYKPIMTSDKPVMSGMTQLCNTIFKKIMRITRNYSYFVFQKFVRRITNKNINTSRLFGFIHAYRSAFLTTPDRKIVLDDKKHAFMYVTLYDSLLQVPSIQLRIVRLGEID